VTQARKPKMDVSAELAAAKFCALYKGAVADDVGPQAAMMLIQWVPEAIRSDAEKQASAVLRIKALSRVYPDAKGLAMFAEHLVSEHLGELQGRIQRLIAGALPAA